MLKIQLPRAAVSQTEGVLTVLLDGERSPLEHRGELHPPVIQPVNFVVIASRHELFLPQSYAIIDPRTPAKPSLPWIEWGRLIPSRWWKPLFENASWFDASRNGSPAIQDQVKGLPAMVSNAATDAYLAWTTDSVDAHELEKLSLRTLIHESKRAENWVVLFFACSVAICAGRYSKAILAIGGVGLWALLLNTDGWLVESVQVASLGWMTGVVLLVLNACCKPRMSVSENSVSRFIRGGHRSQKRSGRSTQRFAQLAKSNSLRCLLTGTTFLIDGGNSYLFSNDQATGIRSGVGHSIVIPLDDDNQVFSDVAYVPEGLLEQLRQDFESPKGLEFLSARYSLDLRGTATAPSELPVTVVMAYQVDVRKVGQVLVWPLDSTRVNLTSVSVDGTDTSIGGDFQWDNRELRWTANKLGVVDISLSVTARPSQNEDETLGIHLPIVPVGNAEWEVLAEDTIDVRLDATGRIEKPTPAKSWLIWDHFPGFVVRGRVLSTPIDTIETPASLFAIDYEAAILEDQVIVRTQIELDRIPGRLSVSNWSVSRTGNPLGVRGVLRSSSNPFVMLAAHPYAINSDGSTIPWLFGEKDA